MPKHPLTYGLLSVLFVVVALLGPAAAPGYAQCLENLEEISSEELAQLLIRVDEYSSYLEGFIEGSQSEESIAVARGYLATAQVCRAAAQQKAAAFGTATEPPRRQLVPIEAGPGADIQIPCVLRDQICTDLQGNPTGSTGEGTTQGPAPAETNTNPGPPGDCGGFTRAEIQEAIAQAERTISALERSRGQVVGEDIDGAIQNIRDQIPAAQALLASCQ